MTNAESAQPAAGLTVDQALHQAIAHHQAGQLEVARQENNPSSQEINTLVAQFAEGRYSEAAALAQTMTVHFPLHGFGWKVLGAVYKQMGRNAEALASMQKAAALSPNDAETHNNLGVTFRNLVRLDEAEASYRRALWIKPDFAEVHSNLGITLKDLGRLEEAEASCRRALQIRPDYAEAHNNLGITLHDLGRLDEAEANYRRALQIRSDYAEAHNNLGATFDEQGRVIEAEASYRRALQLKPDFAEAHSNLGNTLHGLGRTDEAEASYRRALQLKPDYAAARSSLIFALDMTTGTGTAGLQTERRRWEAIHAASISPDSSHANLPDPERCLRIGYVSADFKNHSAAYVFGPMLMHFNRGRHEVYAYSNTIKEDSVTQCFQQSVSCWRKIVGLSDEAVAEMIRQDEIDILVDLSGHSAGNRLLVFARKPAPIQVTAWGYIGGTGMKAMDVFFADPVVVPPEEKQFYAEEVRYLPNVVGSLFPHSFPAVNPLPATVGKGITFGSFNRLVKISEEAYRVWSQVLLAVPGSRIVLKTGELDDAGMRARVSEHFIWAGIDPERITLLGKTSWGDHVAAFNQIDITLDPFPHGGGVTTLEGLMMGVPVVTLRWPTLVGRLSASILTTLGLTDWIAETPAQYVEIAKRKAQDLPALAELRQQMRGCLTGSIIGDAEAYTRVVEKEYRQLWQGWCECQK